MLSINTITHTGRADIENKSYAVQHTSPEIKPEGVKVSLSSWLNDASAQGYPGEIKQYLTEVQSNPQLSEREKNAVFFNVVLRPKAEARLGGELAQAVVTRQDKTAWKDYLSSLQYLSMLNSKNDKSNSGLHNNLTKHYQTLASQL